MKMKQLLPWLPCHFYLVVIEQQQCNDEKREEIPCSSLYFLLQLRIPRISTQIMRITQSSISVLKPPVHQYDDTFDT